MELKMPTAEQAYWGLRAMKTVALADGVLDDTWGMPMLRHLPIRRRIVFGTSSSLRSRCQKFFATSATYVADDCSRGGTKVAVYSQ